MRINFWILFLVLGFIYPTLGGAYAGTNEKETKIQNIYSIYLVKENDKTVYSDFSSIDLKKINLEEKPILSIDEIVSYSKNSHEMILTPAVYAKIRKIFFLNTERLFVVCVGKERIYLGTLVSIFSSKSYSGVLVYGPEIDREKTQNDRYSICFSWAAYGSLAQDPRSDPRILNAFKQAGRLRD